MPKQHMIEFVNLPYEPICVAEGEAILEVALDMGVMIAHGCLYGDCGMCGSRLLSGEVSRGVETGLTEAQKADGWLLLCVASPRSDCRIWVGWEDPQPE